MELVYIRYSAVGKKQKYLLLLYIGERNGKLCGIVTDRVSEADRKKILANIEVLRAFTVSERINWLRTYCHSSYSSGYREIHLGNTTKVSTHPISAINK